ncbi:hypothetical protein Aduo_000432 [Ancylostoma duodenale]
MPYATKMNELTWDCGLEHNAWLYLCNNSAPIYPNYTETATATINTKTTPCNITSNTLKVLKNFSKESDAEDLSGQNPKRTNNIGNFAVMIAQAAKGFACTYQKCDGSKETAFVCLYDTVMTGTDQIYTSTTDEPKICSDCAANGNEPPCVARLCQYKYTIAEDAFPDPLCYDDEMTRDMQDTALYMHNYYR